MKWKVLLFHANSRHSIRTGDMDLLRQQCIGCRGSPFGSGCCSVITQTIIENRKQGKRTFLGFFDPSVRPYFEADLLSFTIPMSRFKEMYHTMRESCLFDTHAWGKIRERIQLSQSRDVHILSSPISFPILPDIYLQEIRIEDAAAIYHAIRHTPGLLKNMAAICG